MMRKEFTYKGKSLEELQKMSMTELAMIFPSDIRRKIKRLTDKEKYFMKRAQAARKPLKTHLRDMIILPFMVGKTVMVHDGKGYQQVMITDEMIAHRLGEYALTRRKVMHNAPGIGATRSSSSLSVK
jgi:small subunit ribosomal protein S19